MKNRFNKFLWGVATSAAQVEGAAFEDGRGASIWDVFANKKDTISDGSIPIYTCDSYHRYKEDILLAKEIGVDSLRFSFSWSRILPTGRGKINQKGLDFYKNFVEELLKHEIIPNATIYHWDLPQALEENGGWCNRDIVQWYGDYASILFKEFGDVIPLWATINEPIATYVGYGLGWFAPGRKNELDARTANHHVLLAHGEGVQRFRAENLRKADVGIVIDIWNHHPLRKENAGDIAKAELENEKSYRSYLNPIFSKGYSPALLEYMEENNCMPPIQAGDFCKMSEPIDFFGLNCYNRVVDCCDEERLAEYKRQSGGNYLDNGSEYYPKAIYDAIKILNDEYKIGIPIIVTENGYPGLNEELLNGTVNDRDRINYIEGFLKWIDCARMEGADIRGYYLWSLLDNWEWSAGFQARYGIVHVDFNNQERTLKDSAYWYKNRILEENSIST